MWRSLRFRLLAATILVVLIAVGVTAFVATRRTTGEFQRYVQQHNPLDDRRLAFFLARTYDKTKSWDGIQSEIAQLAQMSGQRVVVADGDRKIVADSDNKLIGKTVDAKWPPPAAALVSEGTLVGMLYLDPTSGAERADTAFLTAVNRSVLFGALIAGLAAVAVTLALSSRILRPVERLTEAAQRMEKGDLTVRVPVTSEDEIGQLAHAFNSMAGSLAQQEQLRRNMVTDVAHELRTPLTNLRGYLEAARDGLIPPDDALVANLYEETMLLSRLVADLQELAQAEAGQLTLLRQPSPALWNRLSPSCGRRQTPKGWRSPSGYRPTCRSSTWTPNGWDRCCATC
jgi:signal transduction histidine kinase